MLWHSHLIVFLILDVFIACADSTVQKRLSLSSYHDTVHKCIGVINIVIRELGHFNTLEGTTHYGVGTYESTLTHYLIDKKILQAHFRGPGSKRRLRAKLWDKFEQDLVKLQPMLILENTNCPLSCTMLYFAVIEMTLYEISQADPSSLTIFRELNPKTRTKAMYFGTLKRGDLERPCVYQSSFEALWPESRLFSRGFGLLGHIHGGTDTITFHQGSDPASHWSLDDNTIASTDEGYAIYLSPLPSAYPSYTSLSLLVKMHPAWDGSVGSHLLKCEPKASESLIRALLRRVIQVLLECHNINVVHNYNLLRSVVVPVKALDMGQDGSMTDPVALEELRLTSFQHAFMIEGSEKYSYLSLTSNAYYKPSCPVPEEVDKTLDASDLTKFDSWHVGILLLSFHLGCSVLLKVGQVDLWKVLKLGPDVVELASGLLEYDPQKRLALKDALKHRYFKDVKGKRKTGGEKDEGGIEEGPERKQGRTRVYSGECDT